MQAPRQAVLLLILDGFGVNPSRANNAVSLAATPQLDGYFAHYPHTVLKASGRAVGLPEGQMGNSEVGHMTIGAGTVMRQDLVLINDAIESGRFYENPVLNAALDGAARRVHLLGLASDGGVHSHLQHLLALLELCRRRQIRPWLHLITDGRDTPPCSALDYLAQLTPALQATGGRIASVSGRFFAMDRDRRWERTRAAWRAYALGECGRVATAQAAIEQAYAQGVTDEFIEPVLMADAPLIEAGDHVVFFNFRNDRPRQLTEALARADFTAFDRGAWHTVPVTCFTEYDAAFALPVAFVSERPSMTLGAWVSEAGLAQFRCAETEKYAHVTFFLNGGREAPFTGEQRLMVPSPPVATYDLCPEMSAAGVADATIQALRSHEYGLLIVNFANGDMVGHTAIREAVIRAVETLDREVGRVLDVATTEGYSVLLTADHGNCDEMVDAATGQPHTQHTVYPVPCLVIDRAQWRLAINAGLSSVAPTVIQLMGLSKPPAMSGESLLLAEIAAAQQRRPA